MRALRFPPLAASAALAGALALAAPAAGQTQVWYVDDDGGPGADFLDLQPAIDAASDGDAVIVRPGTYGAAVIDGRALTLAADGTGPAIVAGAPIVVRDVAADQDVLVQGMVVASNPGGEALSIESCAGAVVLERCTLGPSAAGTGGGARVLASTAVSLVECTVIGASVPSEPARPGLHATGSAVLVHGGAFQGGAGPGGGCQIGCGPAGIAGEGVRLEGAYVFAAGATFQGGAGDDGAPPCGAAGPGGAGAAGGDGARLTSQSVLHALDVALFAGPGGDGGAACPPGPDGAPLRVVSGTFAPIAGPARTLAATSPIFEGDVVDLVIQAQPGDLAAVAVSLTSGFVPVPALAGVLAVGPTAFFTVALGVVPASGTLLFPAQTIHHPTGAEVVVQHLQAGFLTAQGEIRLGGTASVVIQK